MSRVARRTNHHVEALIVEHRLPVCQNRIVPECNYDFFRVKRYHFAVQLPTLREYSETIKIIYYIFKLLQALYGN